MYITTNMSKNGKKALNMDGCSGAGAGEACAIANTGNRAKLKIKFFILEM
jgi:hypothetical protein